MHFKSKLKYLCLLILLYPIPFSHSEILIDQKDFQASEDNALTFDTINVCVEGDCYDILQVSGAIETKTAGGIAKKDRKTIYVFSQDKQNGRPTYKGKDWPIITTYNNFEQFYVSPNVSADIKINSKNEVLINNRPIYQFIGDRNDTDAKGIGLSDSWHALKSNGEKLLIDSFSPIDPSPNPINPIIPDPNPFPGPLPDPRLPIPGPDPITGPIKPGPTPIKNYPPEFTNFIPEFEIQENELFVYKFNVFDPEGDQVFFALSGEDAALFEISADGRLSFKNSPDYEEPLNKNYDNKYRIKVLINDSLAALQNTTESASPEDKSSSADFTVNVSNYDEDIIAFSLTGINGTLSSAPAIDISMEVDSYTNSHEAQLLITKGEQQYWTSQQPLSPSNFVHDYDHRFNLPVNAPSGTWEVKQVKLISNDGTYIYSKDLLISKGYQTSVNLTNPVADEVNPELISIQNLAVSGIDSNPNTNIVVSIQASVSDAQNDFSRAAGGLKSPNYDGGGGVVSDWALLDLQTSPFTADFAWVLDPKTASGNYTIDSLRFYDTAGNRTTHRGTSSDLDNYGDYVITINNPIEDTHTPELSDFSLSGYIDNDSRKILKIETNINNGEPGNTELRRQYVRIQSPDIGNYDTDNFVSQPLGSFENVAYIKLPRGAPDGMYSVDFFFVVDNALNDNKLTNQELVNTFGEGKTKVVFGTSENCPAITSSPNFSANENQTAIGNVTVATNCTSNSFQLSGQDQASISIDSSGVLTFNTAPDYETKSSYTVDLTVTDTVSNETASQTLLITINNLNDNNPVITSSNTFTINENETNVGTIVATDADGDPISFALSGVDAGYFSLGAASGVLSFLTAADYEEQASYSIVVTASDGENSVDQTITVSLNDVNDTCPTITSPSTYSADENQTVIGNITVDSACTNIIFEIAGTDQNLLTVNNLTGALAFVNAPDFESKNEFSAIAKATDGNNNVSQKAIAISVNNLNDNFPVITSSNSRNMDEGETAVITVNATDADDSSDPGFTNFSYTINGVDANFFSINGAGNIEFSSPSDFETQSNYSITVNVSDGLNITSQAISVSLNDLNDEVPVFTSASSWTIDENNTIVGSVTATDQDANSTLSYSISGGDDAGAFILNANNGTLEFATAPDYETKTSYNLEVTVSDGANTASQNITVAVNNLDDNDPIFTSPSTINVNENESFIGTLTATDADGETITFSTPSGNLIIDEITGDISWPPTVLSNNNRSNYEWYQNRGQPQEYPVYAYSGQSSVYMLLAINVLDVNEAPERLSGGVKDCGAYEEEAVRDLDNCIYDEDEDTLSYTLTGGADSSVINITSNGIVSYGGDLADFENPLDVNGDNIYEYQVNVSDGQLSTLLNITDTIANTNDNRAYVNPKNITINENQKWNILDLKPLVIDADGLPEVSSAFPGSWSFGLCGGLDQNKFNLYQFDPDDEFSNDRVQFIDKPNYENPHDSNSDNIYEFDIKVADGGGFGPCNPMTVTVENINETPTFSYQNEHPTVRRNFYQLRMDENQTGVTFEGSVNGIYNDVTDEEGDTLSFTIEGIEEDSGINRFSINSSGIISWNESGLPNYEMQNPPDSSKYPVRITASDGNSSNYVDADIQLYNLNEAPIFTSTSWSVEENQTNGGDLTNYLIEPDMINFNGALNGTYSFSISGGDAALLSVNSSTGLLTFNTAPDYETKSSYTFEVTIVDSTFYPTNATTTQTVQINITDNLDQATFGCAQYNDPCIHTEPENGDGYMFHHYVLQDGNVTSNQGSFGCDPCNGFVVQSGGAVRWGSADQNDYETAPNQTYTATWDNPNDSWPMIYQVVNVNLTDVVDENGPVFTSGSTFIAFENQTAIGTVTATDADGDAITYTFLNYEPNDPISIDPISGVLTFNSAPDYETKNQYMGEVTASSGEYSNTMTIIVFVNDIVNENAPVFTSSDTFSAAENQTAIGTVTATDADGDAVTYSITASANTDNAFPQDDHASLDETDYYEVSPSAGESVTLRVYDIDDQMKVTFKNSSGVVQQELTYSSTTNQPSFTINVLDYITADGSTIELELTNNPSSGGFTMGWELSVAGSVVYSNSCGQYNMSGCAGDSNSNGVVYESTIYVDANSSVILIDANSGVLTFNSAPDYETKSTYTATVTASDGTYTTNQNITVNVTDVNEGGGNNAPVATAASYNLNLLPKDQNLIGFTLSGTDADGDSLTYSIVSGPSQGTVSLSGANVTYQTNSGVDTAQTDTFTFKVNDGTADSDPATISVNLKTDPLYQHQWHLHNYGQKNFASGPSAAGFDLNVDTVIANGYTGAGVLVSVVDEGLEIAHADLAGNVVAGSWDFGDQDNDPTRPSLDGDHGTSVAGIINSVGWNNVGGRGVAPEASLIGYNWLDHQGGNTQYESWGVNPPGGVVADVYNLSYGQGYEGSFAVGGTIGDEAGGSSTQDALRYGTTNHRNGLGAIYIKSTGNAYNASTSSTTACGEDSTWPSQYGIDLSCTETWLSTVHSLPYMVQVAALGANEVKSSYSTPGPSVWISGFGGEYGYSSDLYPSVSGLKNEGPAIMTTDQSGCTNGYVGANMGQQPNLFNDGTGGHPENPNCDYTSNFNGTSSAAPTVSGVVALMLEANPNLTWRDVKHILATTADKFDDNRTTTLSGIAQYEWETNAAGYNFHNWYGFGKIDAAEAISEAASYSSPLGTNFVSQAEIYQGLNTVINDLTITPFTQQFTAPAGSLNFVEFIRVLVNIDHQEPWTFGLRLTSPEGTQVNILQPYTNFGANPYNVYFPIGVNAFYGEEIAGDWTLDVIDYEGDEVTGTLLNWGLIIYGGSNNSTGGSAPVFTSSDTFSAAENQTAIGTVTATDADGDVITYSVSGNELSINASTGVLTFNSAPDYETKSSYTATVTASDGTNSTEQNITVNVTDVANENAPVFTSSDTFSAAENQTAIGTVTATDADGDTITYEISSSAISIGSTSGVLTFDSAPDYETQSVYTAQVIATDGTFTTNQNITVNVTDVNEGGGNNAPVATAASYNLNLLPKDQNSTNITLSGTDADGDSLTYSIVSGPSQGTVSLSGANVTYQTNSGVDTAQTDTFTFKVNDGTADSDPATISVNLKTDPLYKYQWHLNNIGQTNFASTSGTVGADLNVDTVISSGYTGVGVLINVVDEGLEIAHEDLVDNVVAGSYDLLNLDTDPTNDSLSGDHGTSVAGISNSVGWNNKGGRGVAPEASLIGYNFLKNATNSNEYYSWGVNPPGGVVSDIYNLSYGTAMGDGYALPYTAANQNSSLEAAMINVTSVQRNGNGAYLVKSSANNFSAGSTENTYCGRDGIYPDLTCSETILDTTHQFPYPIVVAALRADDVKSSYSTPGPSVWISGYGGEYGYNSSYVGTPSGIYDPAIMTVDQSGCTSGYVGANSSAAQAGVNINQFNDNSGGYAENANCNYHSAFNGTSSAAPTVTGVIALMLEANPNLTWRDLKHILATTATKIDANRTFSLAGITQYEWETNMAGYDFHNWYGFGKINAAAAISAAETYSTDLGTMVTTGIQYGPSMDVPITYGITPQTVNVPAPTSNPSANTIDFVRVTFKLNHAVPYGVGMELISPQGTVVNILQPLQNINQNPVDVWVAVGVNAFYGEQIAGNWTLQVTDYFDDSNDGILQDWFIEVFGH